MPQRAAIRAAPVRATLLADFLIVGVEDWRGAVGAHDGPKAAFHMPNAN